MIDAYSKVVPEDRWKPSTKTSHKGLDNPAMFDAVVDKHFESKEKEAAKFRKADWSRQDKPHTVTDDYFRQYYDSPVKNSHQYPNIVRIRPPTYDVEIPPKSYSLQQKKEDNEPIYVGMNKYTRSTLPHKLYPMWK